MVFACIISGRRHTIYTALGFALFLDRVLHSPYWRIIKHGWGHNDHI